MLLEEAGEVAHQFGIRLEFELSDQSMDALVLEERLDEQLAGGAFLVGERREELLLLLAEVADRVGAEEAQEVFDGGAALGLVAFGRTAQPACLNEGVMVIVRERDEGGMTLHARRSG